MHSRRGAASRSLFWRMFLANAVVLVSAGIVLGVSPLTVSFPITLPQATVLASGIAVMLLVNLALMRKYFTPLTRLAETMRRVDPLKPGERIELEPADREVEELAANFNDMLERLETERRESAQRELEARDSEQRRIAGELHDEIGQRLTVLLLMLANAQADADPQTARRLHDARDLTHDVLDDLRDLVRRLRPEGLDELGIDRALEGLADEIQNRTGAVIARHVDAVNRDVPSLESLVVYRIAQEALTNAIRHAPGAPITLELRTSPDRELVLKITDHGPGLLAEHRSGGRGLRWMAERALLVGGALEIDSSPRGTAVTLTLPRDTTPR